jgi:hypothetical protein
MPVLLSFFGCEKVIFEQGTNSVSAISILHDVFVPVIRSVPVPPDTQITFPWCALAIWHLGLNEEDVWWEQRVTLIGEQDEILVQSEAIRFKMEKPVMRAVSRFTTFPVYRHGTRTTLKLYLRTLGVSPPLESTEEWSEKWHYPIRVNHTYYPS